MQLAIIEIFQCDTPSAAADENNSSCCCCLIFVIGSGYDKKTKQLNITLQNTAPTAAAEGGRSGSAETSSVKPTGSTPPAFQTFVLPKCASMSACAASASGSALNVGQHVVRGKKCTCHPKMQTDLRMVERRSVRPATFGGCQQRISRA